MISINVPKEEPSKRSGQYSLQPIITAAAATAAAYVLETWIEEEEKEEDIISWSMFVLECPHGNCTTFHLLSRAGIT